MMDDLNSRIPPDLLLKARSILLTLDKVVRIKYIKKKKIQSLQMKLNLQFWDLEKNFLYISYALNSAYQSSGWNKYPITSKIKLPMINQIVNACSLSLTYLSFILSPFLISSSDRFDPGFIFPFPSTQPSTHYFNKTTAKYNNSLSYIIPTCSEKIQVIFCALKRK